MTTIVLIVLGVATVLLLLGTQGATVGTLTRFGAGLTNPPTTAFEYKGSCTIGKHNSVLSTDGIRGTRSHPSERTRAGVYTVGGSVTMEPGPTDLDFWLQNIMGGTPTGSPTITYPLAETLPTFFVGIDRGSGAGGGLTTAQAQFLYSGCKVDKAVFSAMQGGLLEMALDIEGLTESQGTLTGFAALVPSLQVPYVMMDAALTIGGTTYQFAKASVTIDNHLKKDRFMNSIVRTDLPALDRIIGVSLSLPFTSDTISLYDANQTAAAVVLTFTNGASVLTFTLAAVQFPTEPPEMPGREEVLLPYNGIARTTGATKELVITNHD